MTVKPTYRVNLPATIRREVCSAVAGGGVRPVRVRVIGVSAEVRAVLRNAQERGTLVEYGIPTRLKDGRLALDVTLMQPANAAAKAPVVTKARVAVAGGVLVALAAAAYGAFLLVQWVLSNVPAVAAGLAALVILPIAAAAVKAGCKGLHCGGCDS